MNDRSVPRGTQPARREAAGHAAPAEQERFERELAQLLAEVAARRAKMRAVEPESGRAA